MNVLSFLAIIPGLLPSAGLRGQLDDLRNFHQEALQPRFEKDNGVSVTSSLLRKMAVKAEGRWWMVKLGTNRPTEKRAAKASTSESSGSSDVLRSLDHRVWKREEVDEGADFAPPEGLEVEIESLLQNLSDKVRLLPSGLSRLVLIARLCAGHNCPILRSEIHRSFGIGTTSRIIHADH